jgi:hypothetical protein
MSLLSVIQSHCRIHGLNYPGSVVASSDYTIQQLYGIVLEVVDEMVNESKFNVISQQALWTLIADEDQGEISTIAPNGYSFAYLETFYDRTLMRPLYGPVTETEWQALKAIPNPGPFYKFRIWQDHLFINPVPATPFSLIAFEYASSWAYKSSTGTVKSTADNDSDIFLFPEIIIRRGLAFRWKQIKGLPYQADEKQYWNLLNNYIARDKVKRRVNISEGTPYDIQPGIFVPSGNWNV